MDPNVLARKQLPELRTMAAELRMRGYQRLRKADLIEAIVKEANRQADPNRRSELANGSGPDRGDESGGEPVVASDNGEQLQLDRDDPVADDGGDSDGDGDGDGDQGDDGDDGQRRRRRSRRERRRNRGTGDDGRSQQPSRDDEQGTETGESRTGVLDVLPEGYGFLRTTGYLPGDRDAYVSQSTIRKIGLRRGDIVSGPIRQHKSSDKVPALAFVHTVNGIDLSDGARMPSRPDFKDMTPLFPDERLHLETQGGPISMRIVDLMSPIGKGQRGLIVSPPKAGKTTILKELGQAIVANNPECHLMVVLVDERPEEVTDMQRSVKGEIVASTFDRPADDHTQIAELAMERAKRLVEQGQDVVVLLDSITRLARAYNLSAPASGRIMSGGVDSTALYPPKRFFGAARNIEDGGSLTIIATALIETGSKMDEVIFEEFKGTGNMELRLDRRMEQKRIFPAIDIDASGTRKEELLFDREELAIVWKLRRVLAALEGPAALELLIDKMKATRSNNQFLTQIQSSNLQT
jgi:transcription termination factor Rho